MAACSDGMCTTCTNTAEACPKGSLAAGHQHVQRLARTASHAMRSWPFCGAGQGKHAGQAGTPMLLTEGAMGVAVHGSHLGDASQGLGHLLPLWGQVAAVPAPARPHAQQQRSPRARPERKPQALCSGSCVRCLALTRGPMPASCCIAAQQQRCWDWPAPDGECCL